MSITTYLPLAQINYGGVLFDNIVNNVYYQLLLAQMQSGKTGTYLFAACELLRNEIKKKVVIISGNREKALKNQTVNLVPFLKKYENYLNDCGFPHGYSVITELSSKISVVWGGDLKKAFISDNSLIIIDESHYGQDHNQQLNQFLIKSGLSATGNIEELKSKNIHIISVSATPFSEIVANNNKSQGKEIVRFVPSSQYKSVKNMVDAGLINGYDDWTRCLDDNMFLIPSSEPSYAIIRVSSNKYDEVVQIANNNNWEHKIYDTTSKTHNKIESLNDDLSIKPTKNTLIILNQGCRMGSVLTKTYIKFCVETTASMKSDTLLQSLIGRCCGYHKFKIKLFIPNKIYNNGEIQKYINLMDNPIIELQNIPLKARNIVNKRELNPDKENRYPIIPHKLIMDEDELEIIRDVGIRSFMKYAESSLSVIYSNPEKVIDYNNSPEQFQEIKELIDYVLENPNNELGVKIKFREINNDNSTYAGVPKKIRDSISCKIPKGLGSGAGTAHEITVFYFTENYEGFKKGDVYLQTTVKTRGNYEYYDNPNNLTTNGIEMFANREEAVSHTLETGEIVKANGHYPIMLKPETAESVELMCSALMSLIEISINCDNVGLNMPRRVLSITDKNNKFKGILVNREVLNALNPNGRIYNMIKEHFNGIKIRLKIGPQLVLLNKDGIPEPLSVRLKEISW
jgi:hypothetical protein